MTTHAQAASPAAEPAISQRQLWRQFLPLSLTDVTMAFGDPLTTATIAHLPDANANLAAVGVAKTLAVFFESPIIMVLHASNALSPSAQARQALWRFVLLAVGTLSFLMIVLTLPPVFQLVGGGLLGIPAHLVELSRTVLMLVIIWPAAIGWRRYFQGQLIHAGHARAVATASLGRLAVVAGVLAVGYRGGLNGAYVAAVSLALGVVAEALLVTLAACRLGVTHAVPGTNSPALPVDLPGVWRFYWPLANSMLVVWGGRAVVVALIARASDAPLALAAWPAAWGMVSLIANATRMVQQVIIRNRDRAAHLALLRFAATVGLACTAVLLAVGLAPAGAGVLGAFVGPNPDLLAAIRPVILLSAPVPLLVALQNAVQGFMIGEGRTSRVNVATWIGTAILLGGTTIGLNLGLAGATAAAVAMLAALFAEASWLTFGLPPGTFRPIRSPKPHTTG